jgi:hypothetical protein
MSISDIEIQRLVPTADAPIETLVADLLVRLVEAAADTGIDPRGAVLVLQSGAEREVVTARPAESGVPVCALLSALARYARSAKHVAATQRGAYREWPEREVHSEVFMTHVPCAACSGSGEWAGLDAVHCGPHAEHPHGTGVEEFVALDPELVQRLGVALDAGARRVTELHALSADRQMGNLHAVVPVCLAGAGGAPVEVDEGIAALLAELDRRGLYTGHSCQGGPGATRDGYFTLQKLEHLPAAIALLEELCAEAGRKDVFERGLGGKRTAHDVEKAWRIVPRRRGDDSWLVGVYIPAHDMAVLDAAARHLASR